MQQKGGPLVGGPASCTALDETGVARRWVDLVGKVEQVEQVVDCRAIGWNVGFARRSHRVGLVIAAPHRNRRQAPIVLDELQDGHVI